MKHNGGNRRNTTSAYVGAGFRGDKTREGFDFAFTLHIDQQQIQDLASGRFIEEQVAVLIAGPCGTGTSHIAQAIGRCAVRQGFDGLFSTQTQLLGQIHAARAAGKLDRKLQTLTRIPLVIIDDFALKPLKPGQDDDFHALITERYERTSTLITSNIDFDDWGEAFPNKILAASILDRLRHGAYRLVLDGKSFRAPRPSPKNQKTILEKNPTKEK